MDRTEIFDKVCDLMVETLETDGADITEDTRFEELGADSFDLLELVTAFEDEFGLTMDDEALSDIQTVSDAINAIEAAQ
jgi:acyl carrier protein